MGIDIIKDPSLQEIHTKLENIVTKINWYKDFLSGDYAIPEDVDTFLMRNKDIMNSLGILDKELARLQECEISGDYTLSDAELELKIVWSKLLLTYARII